MSISQYFVNIASYSLSATCIGLILLTLLRSISPELESGAVHFFIVSRLIVGSVWRSLCLLNYASMVCDIAGVGKFGEYRIEFKKVISKQH